MVNRIYSFLGLAAKARRLNSGDETCERAVKAGKALLVIVAEDASENTRKKFSDMCKHRGVQLRLFGEKELLGRYTGKEIRSVIVILESGFANRLMELIDAGESKLGGGYIGKS